MRYQKSSGCMSKIYLTVVEYQIQSIEMGVYANDHSKQADLF